MLVANYDYGLPFRAGKLFEFVAVPDSAHVARIGVQEVHRPIFGLSAVVSERASDLKLNCPLIRKEQIRRSLCASRTVILGEFVKVTCD